MIKETTKCPYSVSGICHHPKCIYRPNMECMKENEFRDRMKYVKKGKKKYEHKGFKNIRHS